MRTTRRDLLRGASVALPMSVNGFVPPPRAGRDTAAQEYFPSADRAGGWRKLEGEAEVRKAAGMQKERLDQAFEYTKTTSRFGGLLVARRGYLVYERYFGRANREVTPNMASCGKMFTSVCWGILLNQSPDLVPNRLQENLFTEKYLPEAFPLSDPRKANIKLGHLLTMTSGMAESSRGAAIVQGQDVKLPQEPTRDRSLDQDQSALRTPMWTEPGGGYFYSSQGVHVASIALRRLAGMEMQSYIDQKLAKSMQFGGWGYALERPDGTQLPHTPGGGGIALRATDALRFGYLLLRKGRWNGSQVVPEDYVQRCSTPSPFNRHSPFSLQFEVNRDGHIPGAPPDVFFKSGAGGFCLYVIPSLDMVLYKMACVGLPEPEHYDLKFGANTAPVDDSRDTWKPHPFDQFHDGPVDGDTGTRRTLEMVVAAVI